MMRRGLVLFAVVALVSNAAQAQSGVTARNQAGDSPRASDDSGYVEIPDDKPPEEFFTLTYNPGTPLEGTPGWYDVRAGDDYAADFKREFVASFSDVKMSFPVVFSLGLKEEKAPFPAPEYTVDGATEMDSLRGESPNLPYRAFYVSEGITDSLELKVKDILKEVEVQSASGDDPAEKAYRWSLGWIGKVEPIAITSSLLFELPDSEATDDIEYGIIVPFSEGGDYLSSIDEETDKPIFNPRLRAVYLHKPDDVKVKLSWEPSDALHAWHTPFKARTDGDEYYANGKITSGDELVHKDDTNPIFLEAIKPGTSELKWGIGEKVHTVKVFTCDMAVDANRDGTIKFAGNVGDGAPFDVTSRDQMFRFWINNDQDSESGEVVPVEQEDNGTLGEGINSKRDLEDCARLWMYFGGLHEAIVAGDIKVGLKWKNTGGTSPAINVYATVAADGSDSYLKSESDAQAQFAPGNRRAVARVTGQTAVLIERSQVPVLQNPVWEGLSEATPSKYFLFEGLTEGKGELCITFHDKDGNEMVEGASVWLELKDIKKMYQRSTGDEFAGANWDETDDTIIFVHGWRVSPEGRTAFAETFFKRLWHRGFKGRFAAFQWETHWNEDNHFWAQYIGPIDAYLSRYNDSEYVAWNSAAALKTFVNGLPGERKHIAAHSMGNIVASEAIRMGMGVDNYALMQAAVPSACYDPDPRTRATSTGFFGANLLGLAVGVTVWDKQTPDDDPDQATGDLAYRGRFSSLGVNLVSFYLERDYATFMPWEVNNDQTKPEGGLLAANFRYLRNNPNGEKLYKYIPVFPALEILDYYLTGKPYEAMSYACSTWGKAVGAQNIARGALTPANNVDLSGASFALPGESFSGFGDEHSGQFNANIQFLKLFYDTLINKFEIGPPNP